MSLRWSLPFGTGQAPRRSVAPASYGGRGGVILGPGGPNDANKKPGQLFMPRQQGGSPGQRQQRIVMPDEGKPSQSGGSLEGVSSPAPSKFRPPPGFMNETISDDPTVNLTAEDMLGRLRQQSGKWYQLAKLFPSLNSKGYDAPTIDGITGINPATQSKMVVAATVHDSLVASNTLDPQVLEHFDYNGEDLLHPFRFLPVERREAAALYIYENRLDGSACEVLARAMKEWERRTDERPGFTESPADCMAFKYLRDALECRRKQDIDAKIQQALITAGTESARQRLLKLVSQQEAAATAADLSKATLQVLRLSTDELGFRPIPQVASLALVSRRAGLGGGGWGGWGSQQVRASCRAAGAPPWRSTKRAAGHTRRLLPPPAQQLRQQPTHFPPPPPWSCCTAGHCCAGAARAQGLAGRPLWRLQGGRRRRLHMGGAAAVAGAGPGAPPGGPLRGGLLAGHVPGARHQDQGERALAGRLAGLAVPGLWRLPGCKQAAGMHLGSAAPGTGGTGAAWWRAGRSCSAVQHAAPLLPPCSRAP
jgi:hypothetical protein